MHSEFIGFSDDLHTEKSQCSQWMRSCSFLPRSCHLPRHGRHESSGAALASGVVWTTNGAMTPVEKFATPWETRVQWSRIGFSCGLDGERRDDSRGVVYRALGCPSEVEPHWLQLRS